MSFTTRFAHLLGLSVVAAAATPPAPADLTVPAPSAKKHGEDERDPKRMENESDEEYGKRCDTAREEEDDNEEHEPGEDEEECTPRGKKGKKGAKKGAKKAKAEKPEEDDDDSEEDDKRAELEGTSLEASARDRERARCAAILSHPKAAVNLGLALSLAFDTRMTRKEARAVMERVEAPAAPAPATGSRSQLRERMEREPGAGTIIKPAADAGAADPTTPAARAASALAAAEAVRWNPAPK